MKRRQPNDNDQLDMIVETQQQLDNKNVESLQFFKIAREALLQQQQTELKRLTAKYGRNHARVQKLEAKVLQAESVGKAVDIQLNIMKMQGEPLPAEGWRVQGYVFSVNGESLPGLTVAIGMKRGEEGTITRTKGTENASSGTTNEIGFYYLTLTPEELKKVSQYSLYLLVLDRRGHVIYTSKDKLMPTAGVIDFHDVTISNIEQPDKPERKAKGKGRRK